MQSVLGKKPSVSANPFSGRLYIYFWYELWFQKEGRVHKEDVGIVLHRRRKNATPVLGMGEPTSITLIWVVALKRR